MLGVFFSQVGNSGVLLESRSAGTGEVFGSVREIELRRMKNDDFVLGNTIKYLSKKSKVFFWSCTNCVCKS